MFAGSCKTSDERGGVLKCDYLIKGRRFRKSGISWKYRSREKCVSSVGGENEQEEIKINTKIYNIIVNCNNSNFPRSEDVV